ncbi:hypothetical protein DB31_1303 [Hyalangium minutum]|uniref:Uncharacterized protein n=1 Tax=Hyalangium minutum TaxID=394096 RepID=A0A085WEX5_9BACT|nr:hypothetical protein DB31_1303 [Hyalangium minutum]
MPQAVQHSATQSTAQLPHSGVAPGLMQGSLSFRKQPQPAAARAGAQS